MRYSALNNQPNISLSRFATSCSLRLDDRNFPHVVYFDQSSGQMAVCYQYWDGLKWAFKNTPKISVSNNGVLYSPNALVLDSNYNPYIAFSRKTGSGTRLILTNYDSEWILNSLDVNYQVGWIGVNRYDGISGSSSSSSSISSLLSSHFVFFVTVYDATNSQFKTYKVNNDGWVLVDNVAIVIAPEQYSTIRMDVCNKTLGMAFIDDNSKIQYTFLDLELGTYSAFNILLSSLLYGTITDMDLAGGSDGYMYFGYLAHDTNYSYVLGTMVNVDDSGETSIGILGDIIEYSTIDVVSDYIVNGYRKIGICFDGALPIIMAQGIISKSFSLINFFDRYWASIPLNLYCISSEIVINDLRCVYGSGANIAFSANSGDIYYLQPLDDAVFDISTPEVAILNDFDSYRTNYSDGILNGHGVTGSHNNKIGCILKDTQIPLLVAANVSSVITSADLVHDKTIVGRNIDVGKVVNSIDVNQINGDILATISNENEVVIYSKLNDPIYLTSFDIVGNLKYPLDARFDYVRRRMWIADTGNQRILGLDMDIFDAQVNAVDIVYPHSLSVDLVSGGVFVKAYTDTSMNNGIVYCLDVAGKEISSFVFATGDGVSSSESDIEPTLPFYNSMVYDHVRQRIWWLNDTKIYVADIMGNQIQSFDIGDSYFETRSIDVEFSTGNVFVIAKDLLKWFLIEISKDNREILASAYIEEI
jgi:ribosomal protein S11